MSTLVVQPSVADCMLYAATPDTNYNGTGNNIWAAINELSPYRLDFSALPAGAVISLAVVELYGTSGLVETLYCRHLLTTDWTEAATWNHKDGAGGHWAGGGAFSSSDWTATNAATYGGRADAGWNSWTITDMVKHCQTDHTKVLDFVIMGTSGLITYSSNTWSDAALRPKLTITYTLLTVTSQAASSIGSTTAVMNGNVTSAGDSTVDYLGFVYEACGSDQGDPGNVAPETQALYSGYVKSDVGDYGTGAFASGAETVDAITGLTEGTIYHGRACAHNAGGWAYGADITFTTVYTHRISNGGTGGIKMGGMPIQNAKILFYDVLLGVVSGSELTDVDGMFVHDEFTEGQVQPRFVCICIYDTKATLTTAQGSHKDLKFDVLATDASHWYPGEAGNALSVHYHHTGTLGVSVVGAAITININAGTTTATQMRDAVNAHADAGKMVVASYALGQNGSGTPAVMDATALVGGAYFTAIAHEFITPHLI